MTKPPVNSATVKQNAKEEASYIEGVRALTGAQHVDVVAHSMGGLISRRYVKDEMPSSADSVPVVRHLVQMGTPNMGSPCADQMMEYSAANDDWDRWPQPSTTELTTWVNEAFNREVHLGTLRGVKLSNMVGTNVSFPCGDEDSDGVVPVWSAAGCCPRTACSTATSCTRA